MEFVEGFVDQVYAASTLVWTIAFLLSAACAYLLNSYIGDMIYSTVVAALMFVAVMVGHVGFMRVGLYFTSDESANVIASAGISICAITTMTIIMVRIFNAFGDYRQARHNESREPT